MMKHQTAFIDVGADLTAVDDRGQTRLHVTARWRHRPDDSYDWRHDIASTFKQLKKLVVNPYMKDTKLKMAIDVAVSTDLHEVVYCSVRK